MTVRAREGLPPLRGSLAIVVRDAIREASRGAFRVVHFSIQTNHIHLIVEAADERVLARGMQWLDARVARRINDALETHGNVWRERYHARELRTPRAVRNAIVYVLMNAKKHGHRFASGIDALTSALWFDGFATRVPQLDDACPVRAPRTWLATIGWRRRGLIHLDERPRSPD